MSDVHSGAPLRIDVAVRDACDADVDELAQLHEALVDEQRQQRGGALWARREARAVPVADALARAVSDDAWLVVVGSIDGATVGYAAATVEVLRDGGLLAIVEDLYVTAGARGVGVGEAMMDRLVAWAEAQGCIGIDGRALPGDRSTKNFFETFGLKARALIVHRPLGAAAGVRERPVDPRRG